MLSRKILLALAGSLMSCTAFSQNAPAAAAECSRQAGTPSWLPCGPDRTLTADDLATWLVRPGETTKVEFTGGTSGRKFDMAMRPEGKLDLGWKGGTNIGRDWKLEGNKLCLRAYQNVWGGQFNCGIMELAAGKLYFVEGSAGSRNVFEAVSFAKP